MPGILLCAIQTRLVATACCSVMPEDPKKFDIDNIRVAKLPGCGNM